MRLKLPSNEWVLTALAYLGALFVVGVFASVVFAQPGFSVTRVRDVPSIQLWMASPFEVKTWWSGAPLPAEPKGDELGIGAGFKLDIPASAWVGLEGRKADGVYVLWLVPKQTVSTPAPNTFALTGGAYLAVVSTELTPPVATATPLPATGVPIITRTPTATMAPVPVPTMPRTFTIYGANVAEPYMTWWGSDLVIVVPREWYVEAWESGPKKLIERIGNENRP